MWQGNKWEMARFMRDRYLWYIAVLTGTAVLLIYPAETYLLGGLSPESEWHSTFMFSWSILLLAIVAIASWRFGVRGGLVACLAIGLILLPHIIGGISDPIESSMLALLGVGAATGVAFSLLVGTRRQAEKALRESEAKYRGLVTNVKLGIFRSTPEPAGRFLEVNPAMEEITGYSREELLQAKVVDLYVHPEERERTLKEITSTAGRVTREARYRKRDGTKIVVWVATVAVRDAAGKILYIDGIMEDVTEQIEKYLP